MKKVLVSALVVLSSTLAFGQEIDDLAGRAFDRPAVKWLAEVEIGQDKNGWNPYVSDEEVVARFGWLAGLHGVGLGPNTQELLREVGDAELRTDPDIAKWMKPSARQAQGRISDVGWRFQLVAGGDSSSGNNEFGIGSVRVQLESGKAVAKLGVKVTNLTSMEAKIFWFEVSHASTNLSSAENYSFSNLFRKSGLPNFRYDSDQGSAGNRRGYIVVAKLWLRIHKEFSQITNWMNSFSDPEPARAYARRVLFYSFRAEGVGFEPTIPCGIPVFETGALGHYATLPV